MGRIPPEDLDAIRTQVPIAAVIGEHLALKGSPTSMKGLCPFHQERTPSFNVNTTTQTFHCFGCEESGDVIDFIQRIEGEGFRWAVTFLADRYNIPVHFDTQDSTETTRKSRLIKAHEVATHAYTYALIHDPEAAQARALLQERNFDVEATAEHFGLGYAPTSRSVSKLLTTKGFTPEEITEAGLAYSDHGHLRDRFRGRLLWTIRNSFGKPIGFGARKLREDDPSPGKFINTSETPIYKKSEVLFGLDLARKEITRTRQAIVVEGYTDVMAMHLAGKTNTVAACGTAFGELHMHILRRLVADSGEIIFAFDDDEAGQNAARSVYRDFGASMRRLSALPPADGMDPDEIRQSRGDAALLELVENRETLTAAVLHAVLNQMPQDTPEDRVAALDAALPYLNDISDPLLRHDYAVKVATLLRFDPLQVESRITPTARDSSSPPADEDSGRPVPRPDWVEREVLRVFAQSEPIAKAHLAENGAQDSLFSADASHTVLNVLRTALASPRGQDAPLWPLHVKASCSTADETRLIAALTASALPVSAEGTDAYVQELLQRLDKQSDARTIDRLKEKIARAGASEERAAALTELMEFQRQSGKG